MVSLATYVALHDVLVFSFSAETLWYKVLITQLNSTQQLFIRPCDHLHKHIVQYLKYKNSHHG